MKKQFSKKLVLTKETISDLNNKEMSHVKGGYITASCPGDGCNTNEGNCTRGCPSVNPWYCQ